MLIKRREGKEEGLIDRGCRSGEVEVKMETKASGKSVWWPAIIKVMASIIAANSKGEIW